jgi:hypothetical protein
LRLRGRGAPTRNDGNRTNSTVPSRGRLQFSVGSCGVTVNLSTSVPIFQRQRPSPLGRARPQIRQPFSNWSSAICISCHIIHDPSANVGICAAMGLIPSRGSAHDRRVDCCCPSKHQKTSVDSSIQLLRFRLIRPVAGLFSMFQILVKYTMSPLAGRFSLFARNGYYKWSIESPTVLRRHPSNDGTRTMPVADCQKNGSLTTTTSQPLALV